MRPGRGSRTASRCARATGPDHPAQAGAISGVRAVRVALFVGERVVLAMVCHPVDHSALQRHRPEDRERVAQPRARLERAVSEQPMEADRDAERGEQVHHGEDRQVARPRKWFHSTAAAAITPRNGTTTAAMLALRSRRVTKGSTAALDPGYRSPTISASRTRSSAPELAERRPPGTERWDPASI